MTVEDMVSSKELLLCDRVDNGVAVWVKHLPSMEMTVLCAWKLGHDFPVAHTIPADKVMDAFHHPAAYFNPRQCAEVWGKVAES